MNGGVQINAELRRLLRQQLEPKEDILWADQPVPRFFSLYSTVQCVTGLVWLTIVFFCLADCYNFTVPAFTQLGDFGYLLVLSPFFFFGFLLLWTPMREYRRGLKTVYALTDQRALSIINGRKMELQSYPLPTVTQIRLTEKRGGVGDVALICGVRHEGIPTLSNRDPGFYHIARAGNVARQLETLLAGRDDPQFESEWLLVTNNSRGKELPLLVRFPLGLVLIACLAALLFGIPGLFAWATNTVPAGFFFFLMLLLLVGQVRTMAFSLQSMRWPSVEGIITESYVTADAEESHSPRVEYTFSVNGKEYWNNEITYKQRSDVLNKGSAEEIVARYPEGRPVTVYYHPRKPRWYAVLEPGRGVGNWIVFSMLLIFLLTSGVWMAVTWEGFDGDRFPEAWQQAKIRMGLTETVDEEAAPPVTVALPAQQNPIFRNRRFRVTSKHLWVNSDPFGENHVIGDLKSGEIVTAYIQQVSWVLVQTPSGQGGWVLRKYLREIETSPVQKREEVTSQERKTDMAEEQSQAANQPVEKTVKISPEEEIQLFFAAVAGGDIEEVRRYLKKGMSPDSVSPHSGGGPLSFAISVGQDDIALLLIDAGADVNGSGDNDVPLLLTLERCSSVRLVRALLTAGADVRAQDKNGSTPLRMASGFGFGCPEIEPLILEAATD